MIVRQLLTKWGIKVDSKELNRLNRDITRSKKKFKDASKDIKRSIKGITIALAAIGASVGIFVREAGKFEQSEIAFETMLGSAEAAQKMLAELAQFAAKTPFTLPGVEASAKQLLAIGIESEKILPTLKALGDVSAGLSVPMERLVLNFGQVKTQGKLTGRELRDFAIAGVPLLGELAKQMGKSKEEITKLVSAGKIGFPEVEKAFISMSSEGGRFANLMDKQSKSLFGILSNISDFLQLIARDIGGKVLPEVKKMALGFIEFVEINRDLIVVNTVKFLKNMVKTAKVLIFFIKNMVDAVRGLTSVFGGLGNVISTVIKLFAVLLTGKLIIGLGKMVQGVLLLAKAWRTVAFATALANLEALAIPLLIGAAVIALGLIIEDIIGFFQGKDSVTGAIISAFGDAIDWLEDRFSDFGEWLLDFFGRIALSITESVTDAVNIVSGLATGDFSGALNSAKSLVGMGGSENSATDSISGEAARNSTLNNQSSVNINSPMNINVPHGTPPELIGSSLRQGIKDAMAQQLRGASRSTKPQVAF